MAKLRETDLLADAGDEPIAPPPQPAHPPVEVGVQLAALAAQSPLMVDPEVLKVRREQRVMIAFNHMPRTYKERFVAEARRRNMGLKEMFVDMMRSYGIAVPPYEQIDGRRRG